MFLTNLKVYQQLLLEQASNYLETATINTTLAEAM